MLGRLNTAPPPSPWTSPTSFSMREREEANVKCESSFDGLDTVQSQSFDVQYDLSLVCIQSPPCKFGSRSSKVGE